METLESHNERRKIINKNFIIRMDGFGDLFGKTTIIHSAVGYEKAYNLGGSKFITITNKALKKGGDKCKLKINHKLTCTLYSR